MLINKSYVTRSDFDAVEKLTTKTIDEYLRYYYHFYKAVHNTMIANYMEAMEQFEEAERLLEYIPNDIEKLNLIINLVNYITTFNNLY